MKKHEIPEHILERVESELVSDEDLLWVGQPHPTRFLAVVSTKTHSLQAMALGIEIGLLFTALLMSALMFLGIMILAVLITAIAGSIAQQVYWAKNTIYAITNQRAMIIKNNEVETFGKRDLQSIVKKTRPNGRGDIIFRKDSEAKIIPSAYGLMLQRTEETERGFLGIESPQQVELLLLNTFADKQVDTRRLEDTIDDDYVDSEDVAVMYEKQ